MTERKHIALLCTLDTKGEHAAFIKAIIESRGHTAVLVDIGVLGEPELTPAITRREIAAAGGAELDALARREGSWRGAGCDVIRRGSDDGEAACGRPHRRHSRTWRRLGHGDRDHGPCARFRSAFRRS